MCKPEKNRQNKYTKKQRLTAVFICVAFIFVTFLSSLYIIREEEHSCTGTDCPICACIQQCEKHLNQLGTGKAVDGTAAIAVLFAAAVVPIVSHTVSGTTLVSQKVRLND